MSGIYVLRNGGVTISTAITVLQIKTGAAKPIEILRASLTQGSSTTSAQCAVKLLRKTAAATVTIAAAGTNVNKYDPGSPTAGVELGTSATGFTASAEGTDGEVDVERGFNVLNGFEWLATPEERIVVPAASFFALKFGISPPSATWYGEIVYKELG